MPAKHAAMKYRRIGCGASAAILLAAGLWISSVVASRADVIIRSSPGGDVLHYLDLFEIVRSTGQRVVIDGPCYSACTLVLSSVPGERICITRRAVLGFHAPRAVDRDGHQYSVPEITNLLAATYPAGVRMWIARHGGLSRKPLLLRGRELASLYPYCR